MAYDKDKLRPNDIIKTSIKAQNERTDKTFASSNEELGFRTETFSDFNSNNKIDHGFWINDLYFEVPPERITSQEENNFMEFQGLRKIGSHKLPVNVSSEIFGLSFTIPHKNAIVNMDVREGRVKRGNEGNTGRRGGILDLILQFRNVPFASIENAYLRSKLKIPDTHNMVFCLHNISISTSPGEPNTLNVSLTISLMAYTPYSDKWMYKEFWISKKGYCFEDVNPVNLPGKVNYIPSFNTRLEEQRKILQNNLGMFIRPDNYKWPDIVTPALGDNSTPVSNTMNVIDPEYSEVDSLNSVDTDHMIEFNVTRRAYESEPFKAYMDWIFAKHAKRVIDNSGITYDATRIQPYGADDHKLGKEISLTYKEFRTIPLDPKIADRLRLYFKRRLAQFRANLFTDIMTSADGYEQTIIPELPPEYYSETDERKKSYLLFESAKQSEVFRDYKLFVDSARKQGWILYTDDPTSYDLFYRLNNVRIKCSNNPVDLSDLAKEYLAVEGIFPEGQNSFAVATGNTEESFLICDFISGSMHNIYQKIPIQGVAVPTAQYLGGSDSNWLLAVKGIGLNSVKVFDLIKDTIKKQSLLYKYIPEACVVKVENPLINATGDFYFVINGLESATVPEQPGLYSMEMRLTSNSIVIKDTKLKRESMQSSATVKEMWLNELFGNRKDRGAGAPYIRFTKRVGFSVMQPDGKDFPFIQELAATMNLANALIPKSEYTRWGHRGQYPQDWLESMLNDAAKENKLFKIIRKNWKNEFNGFIAFDYNIPGEGTFQQPIPLYFLIRQYEDNYDLTFKNPPATEAYFNFLIADARTTAQVPPLTEISGLRLQDILLRIQYDRRNNSPATISPLVESAAPAVWDFVLEKNIDGAVKWNLYDLDDEVARAAAFTRSDLTDTEPYTRSYMRWQTNKSQAVVALREEYIKRNDISGFDEKKHVIVGYFPPYLAAHRQIMLLAANGFMSEIAHQVWMKLMYAMEAREFPAIRFIRDFFTDTTGTYKVNVRTQRYDGLFVDSLNPKVHFKDLFKGNQSDFIQGLENSQTGKNSNIKTLFLTGVGNIDNTPPVGTPNASRLPYGNVTLGYMQMFAYDTLGLNLFGQKEPISWYYWNKLNTLKGFAVEGGYDFEDPMSGWQIATGVPTGGNITTGGIDVAWGERLLVPSAWSGQPDQSKIGYGNEHKYWTATNATFHWKSISLFLEENKGKLAYDVAKAWPEYSQALTNNLLIGKAEAKYLLYWLAIPYLINALRFDEIYKLSIMTPYFPKTREFIVSTQQNLIGAAYEDLILPNHPFWNEPTEVRVNYTDYMATAAKGSVQTLITHSNEGRGTSFTEPDFYLANPGIDYPDELCIETQRILEVPENKVTNLDPSDAYNVYTQMAGETAIGDLKLLLSIPDILRTDNKATVKEDTGKPGTATGDAGLTEDSGGGQSQVISSELWQKDVLPNSYGNDRTAVRLNYQPDSNQAIEWTNVPLKDFVAYFGDNLDLMDPMVQNFGGDKSLQTSGLTNWTYTEYDLMTHEEARLRLRDSHVLEDFRVGEKILTPKGTPPKAPPIPKGPKDVRLANLTKLYDYLGGQSPLYNIFKDVAKYFEPYMPKNGMTGIKLTTDQLYMFMLMIDYGESLYNPKAQVTISKALDTVEVKGIPNGPGPLPGTVKAAASAYGIGAFLDSSWVGVNKIFVEEYGGNGGVPFTDDELIARRQDPVAQVYALAVNILQAFPQATNPEFQYGSRDPVTNKLVRDDGYNDLFTNIYMQHFLGGGGQSAFMWHIQTDPSQSVGNVGSKIVVTGGGMTVPLNKASGQVEVNYTYGRTGYLFPPRTIQTNKGPLGPMPGNREIWEVYIHLKEQGIKAQKWIASANLSPNAKGKVPQAPKNRVLAAYPFNDMKEDGTGDSSPYMNFSNTRYPTFSKIKDALKSLGRRKLAARRAYPVCKIYFFEEDDIYNKQYIELDEMFTYSSIESIEISDSRKRPASICKITFIDPHGILSGMNQWNKAINPSFVQSGSVQGEALNNSYGANSEVVGNASFVKDTKYEQSDLNFILNTGLKIKVKMGYSNDANKLEEVFLGEVKEVNMDQTSSRIDMVAMGYGAELVAKVHGTTEDETEKSFNTTFQLLSYLMFSQEIVHFGRRKFDSIDLMMSDRSISENKRNYKESFGNSGLYNAFRPGGAYINTYNIPGAGLERGASSVVDSTVNSIYSMSYEAAKQIRVEPIGGPQDDNIFAPNFNTLQGISSYSWFDKWTGRLTSNSELKKVDFFNQTTTRPENSYLPAGGFKSSEDLEKAINKLVADAEATIVSDAGTAEDKAKAQASIDVLKSKSPLAEKIEATRLLGTLLGITVMIFTPIGWVIALIGLLITIGVIIAELFIDNAVEAWRIEILEKLGYIDYTWIEAINPESVKYNIYYSTAWDIFEEMTYRHPGYIKHPKIYSGSNRMTMFFGLPDQNMWTGMTDPIDVYRANLIMKNIHEEVTKQVTTERYVSGEIFDRIRRDKMGTDSSPALDIQSAQINQIVGNSAPGKDLIVSSEKISKFMSIARRRFKPFRRWHNLNSYTDIISNDLEATAEGWYTEVSISYSTAADIVDAADDAQGNDTKSGAAGSNAFINWDPEKSVTVKASNNLIPSNIRSTSFQWPNAKSSVIAKRYARSILAKQAKEMYKGSILVLGSPHIRPYDVIILNDTYNDMYGPIEVEEVHHMFTPDTGFVTQIYPDTFVIQEDLTPYVIFNGVNWEVYQKTEVYIQNTLQAFPLYGSKEDLSTNTLAFLTRYKQIFQAYANESEASTKAIRDASSYTNLEDMEKNPLFRGLAASMAAGAGLTAGLTANSFGGPILGITAGIFTAFTVNSFYYFYASAQITQTIVNYMTDSKAFFMMPLIRTGVPMLAGFNMGYGNTFYKGPLDYIRQYWADGARGINQKQADIQMQYAKLAERNGGAITNWLAKDYYFLTQNVALQYDKALLEAGDLAANAIKGLTAGNLSIGMFSTNTDGDIVSWKIDTSALGLANGQSKPATPAPVAPVAPAAPPAAPPAAAPAAAPAAPPAAAPAAPPAAPPPPYVAPSINYPPVAAPPPGTPPAPGLTPAELTAAEEARLANARARLFPEPQPAKPARRQRGKANTPPAPKGTFRRPGGLAPVKPYVPPIAP